MAQWVYETKHKKALPIRQIKNENKYVKITNASSLLSLVQ